MFTILIRGKPDLPCLTLTILGAVLAEPDYKLTTWDEQATHYVRLSTAEFEEIRAAKANLLEALFIEEKMDIIIENYLELENDILASSARQMVQTDFSYSSAQSQRNRFSRRIINLLSACRGYLDQACHHISNIYGEDSQVAAAFVTSTHEQHDSRLGYRLMEALRNYVQHRGSPLHAVSHGGRWIESDRGKQLKFTSRILMRVSDLAEDSKFKKPILDELKQFAKEEVDLQPFVREYVAGLSVIHQRLRDRLSHDLTNWEKVIYSALERFRLSFPEQAASSGNVFAMSANEEVWLSSEFIEARRRLNQKNRNLANLAARYVTNKIVTQ
jgi:hypothetical protein